MTSIQRIVLIENIKMSNFTNEELKSLFDKKDPCDMQFRNHYPSVFKNEAEACRNGGQKLHDDFTSGDEEPFYYNDSGWGDDGSAPLCWMKVADCRKLVELFCKFDRYKTECKKTLEDTWKALPRNETYCRGEFDGLVCWPHTQGDTFAVEPCPNFLGIDSGSGYRYCRGDGSWYQSSSENGSETWRFLEECNPFSLTSSLEEDLVDVDVDESLIHTLTTIYTTGYAISLVFLIVGLSFFAFFKKLHCLRNYIHVNLMISFVMRYVVMMISDTVIHKHYDEEKWIEAVVANKMNYTCEDFTNGGLVISCRLVSTLWHYAETANYFWLLIEGVHLQLLLVYPMSSKYTSKQFPVYMAFGWGGPWIPVGIWVILRFTLDNADCWEKIDDLGLWLTIRVPVIISIVINFLIFINVVRIIVSKLHANDMERSDYKYVLAKSTLALIPLLGIHYVVFLIVTPGMGNANVITNVKISFELIFTSIQGTLIALFYCFLNSEVQTEVRKWWQKKWQKEDFKLTIRLPSWRKNSLNSHYTLGTTTSIFAHPEDHKV